MESINVAMERRLSADGALTIGFVAGAVVFALCFPFPQFRLLGALALLVSAPAGFTIGLLRMKRFEPEAPDL